MERPGAGGTGGDPAVRRVPPQRDHRVPGGCGDGVSLVAALWSTSAPAALLVLASLVPVVVGYLVVSRTEDRMFTQETRLARTGRYLQDQVTYQRTAQELISLGSARRVSRWFAESVEQGQAVLVRAIRRQALVMLAGGLVTTVALGRALWLVSVGPTASLGGAASGVVAVLSAASVIRSTGYAVGSIMGGSGPVARYVDFLDATQSTPLEPVPPAPRDALAADGLRYAYPGAAGPAVDGVSLTIRRGEMVAVVGANGAGKTTLVNLVLGAFTPAAGRVLLDGRDVTGLSEAERVSTFSLLTQEFGRYELTVRDAVLLGTAREDVGDDEVWAALDQARAAGFVRELPDGLDTRLGQQWGGVGLSGGQWQRLALARIAVRRAPVWCSTSPRRPRTPKPSRRSSTTSRGTGTSASPSPSRTAHGPCGAWTASSSSTTVAWCRWARTTSSWPSTGGSGRCSGSSPSSRPANPVRTGDRRLVEPLFRLVSLGMPGSHPRRWICPDPT